MTDADKLAIAEEKLTIAKAMTARWRSYDLPDILVKEEDGVYQAHRRGRDGSVKWRVVVSDACPIEAVYLARQKLAAEREAAKSPRERRIEKALADVTDYAARWFFSPRGTELLVAAREALKE